MKKLLLLFLLFTTTFTLRAQDISPVTIKILNIDYQLIRDANILVKETQEKLSTNNKGEVLANLKERATYTLIINYHGKTYEESISYQGGRQYVVYIDEAEIKLKGVVIDGSRKFAEKKSPYVSRMPLENLENSQTYNVIPQELIKEQQITDFNAALMTAPGLANITSGVGSGGYRFEARMRGFPTSSGTLKNGLYLNTFSVADLANVESIEVVKGPSSTLFGGLGTISYGGLINISTKKPKPYQFAEVAYSFGGYDLNRFTFDYNTPLNPAKTVLLRVNGALHYNKSFQDYGAAQRQFIAPSLRFLVNDHLTLDIDLEYLKGKQNITAIGLPGGVANFKDYNWDIKKSYTTNELNSKNEVLNVVAKADYKIDDNWTSTTLVSNAKSENAANYLFLVPLSADTIGRRIMRIPNTFTAMTIQQNFVGIYSAERFSNKVLAGLDYNHSTNINSRTMANFYDRINRHQAAPIINIDKLDQLLGQQVQQEFDANTKTFGAYLSDVFSIDNRLHLNAGIRFDNYKDVRKDFQENNFSPKFGAVYEIIENKVSLYANYLNAFKNGYRQDETALFSQFVTKPESAYQYEFGAKYELLNKKLHGNISYYNITVNDILRQTVDGNGKIGITQDGTLRSRGFEIDLTANPVEGLHVIIGYGYNDSKFTKGDQTKINKRPEGTPLNVANFWSSYRISTGQLSGLRFGIGGNYSDEFFANDANTVKMPGYFIMDAGVSYEKNSFNVGIKANNLANKKYFTTNFWVYAQATRNITGTVSYRF